MERYVHKLKLYNKKIPLKKKFSNENYTFYYHSTKYLKKNNPSVEFIRYIEYNKIINRILDIFHKQRIIVSKKKFTDFFSQWISLQLINKKVLIDPLIPYNATKNKSFMEFLEWVLELQHDDALLLFKKIKIKKLCNDAIKHIVTHSKIKYTISFEKNKLKGCFFYDKAYHEMTFHVSHKKLKKLKHLWSLSSFKNKPDFNETLFCLFLRYYTWNSGAHQFAMKHDFKDILRKKYNINFECFASPFNVYYDMYCSLFYDIEKYFNSYGNFYLINYVKGFYIANPPYNTEFLELMVKKFITYLKKSDSSLSFSLGLPNWGKYGDFIPMQILDNSKFLVFKRCMKSGEVIWINESQDNEQKNKITIPSHCRYIIQNKFAKNNIYHNVSRFNQLIEHFWI